VAADQPCSDPEDCDDESEVSASPRRAPRYSKWDKVIKATTLQFYPPCWQEVQGRAKKRMQHDVALFQAFPTRERDLNIATLCMTKALAECQAEGRMVENGKHTLVFGVWCSFFSRFLS
jgi:hypothetical protein